jgi:hypothetical protein
MGMKIYRPKRAATKGGLILLIIIVVYTLAILFERWAYNISGAISGGATIALTLLYVIGVILTVLPLCFKLEVGSDYIKLSFLGMSYGYTRSSDVKNIVYKDLTMFGGLRIGKGIYFERFISGKREVRSVGEVYFGKEGVADAKRALESNISHTSINDASLR